MKSTRQSAAMRSTRTAGSVSLGILLSVLFHVFGAFLFDAGGKTELPKLPDPPLVTFLSPTADAISIVEFRKAIARLDPSVSSLPNPRGFSSTALLRRPEVPSIIESRRDDPQFLPHPPVDLARLKLVPTWTLAMAIDSLSAKQPAPPAHEEVFEIPLPPSQSMFELAGALKTRKLLSLANIPLVRPPAPAQPTVIRLAVSPLGDVKFAVLESSSGAADRDARGLDIARRWRFEALPTASADQWGVVSIYWAAEPATRAPTAASGGEPPKPPLPAAPPGVTNSVPTVEPTPGGNP